MHALSQSKHNQPLRIVSFTDDYLMASSCIEMGLCKNSIIQILNQLSLGGNLIILSDNGKYTLRKEDADHILVEEV